MKRRLFIESNITISLYAVLVTNYATKSLYKKHIVLPRFNLRSKLSLVALFESELYGMTNSPYRPE